MRIKPFSFLFFGLIPRLLALGLLLLGLGLSASMLTQPMGVNVFGVHLVNATSHLDTAASGTE
jgi:hypothetical protein